MIISILLKLLGFLRLLCLSSRISIFIFLGLLFRRSFCSRGSSGRLLRPLRIYWGKYCLTETGLSFRMQVWAYWTPLVRLTPNSWFRSFLTSLETFLTSNRMLRRLSTNWKSLLGPCLFVSLQIPITRAILRNKANKLKRRKYSRQLCYKMAHIRHNSCRKSS